MAASTRPSTRTSAGAWTTVLAVREPWRWVSERQLDRVSTCGEQRPRRVDHRRDWAALPIKMAYGTCDVGDRWGKDMLDVRRITIRTAKIRCNADFNEVVAWDTSGVTTGQGDACGL